MTVAISCQSHPRPTDRSGSAREGMLGLSPPRIPHCQSVYLCCGPTATGALSALLTTCSGRYVVTFPPSHSRFAFSCLGEVSNAPQDHSATGSRAAQRAEWSCSGRCHAPLFPPAIFQVSFSRTTSLPLPFSMRANPDRLLLLLWRLHCLKKR